MAEGCQDESSSAVNRCSPQQDELSSSVSPQTKLHTPGVDRPTNHTVATMTYSPNRVVRDPEVIYDDVPAENLQHPVEGESPNSLQLYSFSHYSLYRSVMPEKEVISL